MIYISTETSLDAACLNPGKETEREHEGRVWMISHTQLPHLAVSKVPVSWRNKRNSLNPTDGLRKPRMPW